MAEAPAAPGAAAGPAADLATAPGADLANDLAACRALLANGSRTFLAASWLLPGTVRDAACALYAFCRQADDEVDGQLAGGAPLAHPDDPGAAQHAAAQAVDRLRERLARIYDDRPGPSPADRAMAVVVQRYRIPAELPQALIDGFEWDAAGRVYDSLHDVQAYAARVAGAVGAMMALLMGVRDAPALARACDLGVAMQLSNIARDVGEDARLGRLYLPGQWLREAGLCPDAWLAAPAHSEALAEVVRRLLREADALYQRVGAGVAALPLGCRPGINAARFLYAQIGLEVERQGLNPLARRAVVGRRRKLSCLAQAVLALKPSDCLRPQPPLPATRYLVESVTGPLQAAHFRPPPPTGLLKVLAIFEKLERQDRGLDMGSNLHAEGGAD